MMRSYYTSIFIFPVVWSISAFLCIICPRSAPLAELAQGQSEAYAIYIFLVILFMLLALESVKVDLAKDMELNQLKVEGIGPAILTALSRQGPQPFFAVPPFACCFIKCIPHHNLSAQHLLWVTRFVKQYAYLQLFFSVFSLWAEYTLPEARAKSWSNMSRIVLKFSGLLAIYGLFVIYKATHHILEQYRTTSKFVAIKIVILLSMLQARIISILIHKFRKSDSTCLVDPAHPEDLDHVVTFWSQFVLLLDTVLMTWLLTQAFDPNEITEFEHGHLELVELELQQMNNEGNLKTETDSDDDGDSD